LTELWQNSFKQEVRYYILRTTALNIPFGMKNYDGSGRYPLMYLFIKKGKKNRYFQD
jgi:hypothetical protein